MTVHFENRRMIVRSRDTERDLKVFPYGEIQSAQYSYSKNPRWKEGTGAKAIVNALTFPAFFLKGKKHWFSLKAGSGVGVLRLDKDSHREFIEEFETRTKVKVEDLGEEK